MLCPFFTLYSQFYLFLSIMGLLPKWILAAFVFMFYVKTVNLHLFLWGFLVFLDGLAISRSVLKI